MPTESVPPPLPKRGKPASRLWSSSTWSWACFDAYLLVIGFGITNGWVLAVLIPLFAGLGIGFAVSAIRKRCNMVSAIVAMTAHVLVIALLAFSVMDKKLREHGVFGF